MLSGRNYLCQFGVVYYLKILHVDVFLDQEGTSTVINKVRENSKDTILGMY